MPRRPTARYSTPAHEPHLTRSARRASGVYYTPPEIARQLAELTLGPLFSLHSPRGRGAGGEGETPRHGFTPLSVLDPACGAGELLLAANDATREQGQLSELHGLDIDETSVHQCRQRLHETGVSPTNIRHGDSLAAEPPLPLGTFDAVLANPPYINIRELARQHPPEYIRELRQRFQTARGNFDLYVLFIERCLAWLRPGGRCGLIVPNKWATLDYARPCRELLAEQATIDTVVDLSAHRVFREASVYPHLLVITRRAAASAPRGRESIAVTTGHMECGLPQLTEGPFPFGKSFDIESQVPTQPLGSLVRLACGTPGYAAAKIDSLLTEAGEASSPALPFITSGNIDRYAIRTGNVRYQGRLWQDPQLDIQSDSLTKRQQQLFAAPKVVIAGLTRRLEAAWDDRGLALGVQVFAATDFQVDPFYLLALLNSKLLSYLFRTRFASKRLGGGYFAVNKGQLAKLPIAVGPDPHSLRTRERLATLAKSLNARESPSGQDADTAIDRLVYQLYGLRPSQIAAVEEHFECVVVARLAAA